MGMVRAMNALHVCDVDINGNEFETEVFDEDESDDDEPDGDYDATFRVMRMVANPKLGARGEKVLVRVLSKRIGLWGSGTPPRRLTRARERASERVDALDSSSWKHHLWESRTTGCPDRAQWRFSNRWCAR